MLILLFVIAICLIVCGCLWHNKSRNDISTAITGIGWVATFIVMVALLINTVGLISGSTLIQKIEMYQTENENIQNEIFLMVENYQKFEKEIYQELKSESPIVLTTLFPELKSNEIVSKQMDIYLSNNKTIKKLKKQQIDIDIYRWWIYFG